MKRPKSMVIMGNEYSIVYLPKENLKGLFGDVEFESKTIRINMGQSEADIHNTLLHEIIHVVLQQSGMAYLLSDKLEEALTRALENGLAPLVTLKSTRGGR